LADRLNTLLLRVVVVVVVLEPQRLLALAALADC
jgi:hypothetical protein